jgi:membrane protease YdiL (CAAX protease family)
MNVSDISTPVIPNQKLETETPNNTVSLAVSKSKFDLSRFNFLKRGLKYFGAGAATSFVFSQVILPFRTSGMDWCPVFPKPVYTYVRNSCLLREYLPGFSGVYGTIVFKAPIVEELMFRVGLQELILKRAPKAILNRFAPSYSGIVDTKLAKIARETLTAAAFSLIHAMPPEMGWPNCSTAKLVNAFAVGLILGRVQEITNSPLLAMLFHSGFNIRGAFLIAQMGLVLQCPAAQS